MSKRFFGTGHLANRLPTLEEIGDSQEISRVRNVLTNEVYSRKTHLDKQGKNDVILPLEKHQEPRRTAGAENYQRDMSVSSDTHLADIYNPNHPNIIRFKQKWGENYLRR